MWPRLAGNVAATTAENLVSKRRRFFFPLVRARWSAGCGVAAAGEVCLRAVLRLGRVPERPVCRRHWTRRATARRSVGANAVIAAMAAPPAPLPDDVRRQLTALHYELMNDEITHKGYRKKRSKILAPFAAPDAYDETGTHARARTCAHALRARPNALSHKHAAHARNGACVRFPASHGRCHARARLTWSRRPTRTTSSGNLTEAVALVTLPLSVQHQLGVGPGDIVVVLARLPNGIAKVRDRTLPSVHLSRAAPALLLPAQRWPAVACRAMACSAHPCQTDS